MTLQYRKLFLINFMLEDDPLPHFICHMYKTARDFGIHIFYLVPIIQIVNGSADSSADLPDSNYSKLS
jgi:hypothetical protein